MRARILAAFVLVAAFVLALVELPLGITYASRQEERLLADMERDARILASLVEEQVEAGNVGSVTSTLQQYESRTGGRVLLTDDAGRTIVDSEPGVALGRDYSRSWAELTVLRLMTEDLSIREMGARLYVSENTVRTHRSAVYRKLGVHSRVDAVARATALGILADKAADG